MNRAFRSFRSILFILSIAAASSSFAAQSLQECEREFAPRSGQAGKDVIWVPTQDDLVMAMLKAAKVTPQDYVVDLGSGDGRIPIAAAKHFGAKAVGIEYNPQMVKLAQCRARAEGVTDKVQIKQADIFETDFTDATVLTMYLLSDLNMKLRPTILKMKPGTRVVSNSFKLGEWSPDELIEPEDGYTRAYLWIVPAQVGGQWSLRDEAGGNSFDLRIEQDFQEIKASVVGSSAGLSVKEAKLRGADLEVTFLDAKNQPHVFKGQLQDDVLRLKGNLGGKSTILIGKRS